MKHTFTKIVLAVMVICFGQVANAQQRISDGTASAPINSAAVLELQSTNKGFLPSRVALTDRLVWAPMTGTATKGMVVFNTTVGGANSLDTGLVVWEGQWNPVGSGGASDFWRLKGNTGTTPPTSVGVSVGSGNYWGTTDAKNLAVGTNATTRMIFDQSGNAYGGNATHYVAPTSSGSFVWGNAIDSLKGVANGNAVFGNGHKLSDAKRNLVAGNGNTLPTANSVDNLVVGTGNIDSAGYSILGGAQNIIGSGANTSIVAGQRNFIATNAAGSAVFGTDNTVTGIWNLVHGQYNGMIGNSNGLITGYHNTQSGTGTNGDNSVMGGQENIAYNAQSSAIYGLSNKDSAKFTFIAGANNIIQSGADWSAALGANGLLKAPNTFAMGNLDTADVGSNGSVIMGGENYSGATFNTIGGTKNKVFGAVNGVFASATKVTGSYNLVGGGNHSAIGASSSVIGGEVNTSSAVSSIAMFGASNKDSASYTLIAGQNNIVSPTAGVSTVTGFGNIVKSSLANVSGYLNNVSNASVCMVGGSQNTITGNNGSGSSGNSIVAGNSNIVFNSNSSLVVGYGNKDSADLNIITGTTNTINTNAIRNAVFGINNTMAASQAFVACANNTVNSTATNSAVFGHHNIVSSPASLITGTTNTVTTLGEANIVYGQQNNVLGTSNTYQNNLCGGSLNTIYNTINATVLSGNSNLDSASFTFIAGSGNTIRGGANYGMAIGQNNIVTGGAGIAIGTGATAGANQMVVKYGSGSVTFDGTANWAFSSDRRLKHNIRPMQYGLAQVMNLKPSLYSYNGTEKTSMGFIAQDVQSIIPELVGQNADGMLNMKYTELIPVLTKAIQEQQSQIEELKKQVEELKALIKK